MFMCDLARELKMTVAELANGRGAQMPAHELSITWPTYYRWHAKEQDDIAREQEKKNARGGRR